MSLPPNAVHVCVVGHPIEHSLSPVIHHYWLQWLQLDGAYTRRDVTTDDFPGFLANLAANGFGGCNVTLPHKQAALCAVERATPSAERIGAVNTVWLERGCLVGDNTDSHGFLANLDHRCPGWDHGSGGALVIGAGGAARAIVNALQERGIAPIHIINRTLERAQELTAGMGGRTHAHPWSRWDALSGACRLVVNTTSLGMSGQPPLQLSVAGLARDCIVTDIVYSPLMTPLLARAQAHGCRVVDGLGMLLHQAVPGFERWFGCRPTVSDDLRNTVLRAMGSPS
jgi:shikimate dehydrogenase